MRKEPQNRYGRFIKIYQDLLIFVMYFMSFVLYCVFYTHSEELVKSV